MKKQRVVVAIMVKKGEVVSYAANEHKKPCTRVGYPTGEGYEQCVWCDYPNHAEYKAAQGVQDATCFLLGHDRACERCSKELKKRNIKLKIVK